MTTYVWDATLLLHAQAVDRGDVLGDLVPRGRHVTTDIVFSEVQAGIPSWVDVVGAPQEPEYVEALARWRLRCGSGGGRNEGEASVLAYVDHCRHEDVALVDDGPARAVGVKHLGRDAVHGSLWLLCQGIHEDPKRRTSVARFCDEVIRDGIRWPFGIGEFERWAREQRLIDALDKA